MSVLFTFEPNETLYYFECVEDGWLINGRKYPKDTGVCFAEEDCSTYSIEEIRADFNVFWKAIHNNESSAAEIAQKVLDMENEIKETRNATNGLLKSYCEHAKKQSDKLK